MSGATPFIEKLAALAQAANDEPLALLLVEARCRSGDAGALARLPVPARLEVLKRLLAVGAPTPELAAIARRTVLDEAGGYRAAEPEPAERMLAVWSGLTPEAAGWGTLGELERSGCVTRLVAAGYPPAAELEAFLDAQLGEGEREAALLAWCRERPWSESEVELAWLDRLTRPLARLEAMASLLARGEASRMLVQEWLGDAERAWQGAPRDNLGRALADARFASLLAAAGDLASAEGLLGHAVAGAERENEVRERARIYRTVLEAAAGLAARTAQGNPAEPWLRLVEKMTNDRVLLREREAFLEARAAAVRTLPRAVVTGGEAAIDRGHQLLKETCRRVPERWLDLLHAATMVRLQARIGRNTELQLSVIGDALRKDGLPPASANITLDEVMRLLVPAAPAAVLALGDKLAQPLQRALWWSSAAPHADASLSAHPRR